MTRHDRSRKGGTGQGEHLRSQAEALTRPQPLPPAEDLPRMFHDLQVHQIELEMQNEELRRAQDELAALQARYFELYDLAPVGYCLLDGPGRIHEANLTLATLLGVERKSLSGAPLSRFILPADQDILFRHIRQQHQAGAARSCELRMVRAGTTSFWARLESIPVPDADGGPGCRMVMSDITDYKTSEAALRAEHELFTAGPVIAITWDLRPGWPVTRVSRNVENLLGYTVGELIGPGFRFASLIHPEDGNRVSREMADHIARRSDTLELSFRLRNRDDTSRWFLAITRLVRDEAGTIVSVHSHLVDQTHLKHAELALMHEHRRLSHIIDGTRAGTWEWQVQTGAGAINQR